MHRVTAAMVVTGFSGAVGNTPLIELRELSRELGRRVLGKAEFLNPGGSVKDRAARGIVDDAEARGALESGGTIVEGTAGNTGIALALVANERGYKSVIVVPDDQSREKIELLRAYGSDVRVVPAVAFTSPDNYYHVARRIAQDRPVHFGPINLRTLRIASRTRQRPAQKFGSRAAARSTHSSQQPVPAERSPESRARSRCEERIFSPCSAIRWGQLFTIT